MRIRHILTTWLLALAAAVPGHAQSPPLSVYGNLPGFESAVLSPSGNRMAILGELNGERRVIVLEEGSRALLTATVGDVKVRGLYWAGEDTVLVYKSETQELSRFDFTTDKAELFSMMVLPLDGKAPWVVFAGNRDITGGVRGFYGISSRDGRHYGYFGGITYETTTTTRYLNTTNPVLYEVDLSSGRSRRIAARIDGDARRTWIVGPDGKVDATLDYFTREGRWMIRNGNGRTVASGVSPYGGVSLVGLGSSGGTLVYSLEDDEGHVRWFELPAAGGEAKEYLQDIAIRDTVFDERTRQLVGYVEEGDHPVYRFMDAGRQKVIDATLKAFAGRSVHLQSWDDAFRKLVVTTGGSGDPGTWWQVDVATGKAVDLGVSYTLRPRDVGEVRMISYEAADGLKIPAVLTLPPGVAAKDLPAIVLPHGGPGARDYPEFDWWAQALASRGYAVLQPNFRGSTGYGPDFQRAGFGEWGRLMQSDLSDGLAFLARSGIVDPRRACIVGASYGGYAALAGVTLQQGIYRCAVSVGGISDLAKMVNDEIRESGANATWIRVLRKEVGQARDLREVSPVRFAAAADAPVLLVHGRDDTVVKHEQSADMARALEQAGKPVELVTLEGEDHWLSRSQTRLAMLEAIVAFLGRHNPAGSGQ